MASIGVLLFRSSCFPCIKRLEACWRSCSIQISWCCAGPWAGLAELAYLVILPMLDAITAPMASSKKYAM